MGLKRKSQEQVEDTKVENEAVEAQVEETVEAEVVEKEAEVVEQEVVEAEEVEQEAEVVEEKPAKEKSTAVAETKPTGVSAQKPAGTVVNVQQFQQEAAAEGFEGVEVGGYGSFPIVVLGTDGNFETNDDDELGNDPITGKLMGSTKLFMCVQKGVSDGPVAYSSDRVNLNTPTEKCNTVEELRNRWDEEGFELELKEYLEVLVEVEDGPEEIDGAYVIMKLPPSAKASFNGMLFTSSRKFGGSVSDRVVEFSVGKKKKTSSGSSYYPWKFKATA